MNAKTVRTIGVLLILAFFLNFGSALVHGPSVGVKFYYEPSYKDLPPDQIPPDVPPLPTGPRPSNWYLTDWWKLTDSYKQDDWLTAEEKEIMKKTGKDWAKDRERATLNAAARFWSWLGTQYKPLSYSDKPWPLGVWDGGAKTSHSVPFYTYVKYLSTAPGGVGPSTDIELPWGVHPSLAHNKFVYGPHPFFAEIAPASCWYIEGGSYLAPDGKEWPLPIWAYPSHDLIFPNDLHPLQGWIDNGIEPWWYGPKCDNRQAIDFLQWAAMTWEYPIGLIGMGFLSMLPDGGATGAYPKGIPYNYIVNQWATAFGTAYSYDPYYLDPSVTTPVGKFCSYCPFVSSGQWASPELTQHMRDVHPEYADEKERGERLELPEPIEREPRGLMPWAYSLFKLKPQELYIFGVPAGRGEYVLDIANWLFLLPIVGVILIVWSRRRGV